MKFTLLDTAIGALAIGFDDTGLTRIVLPEADWGMPTKGSLERAGFKQRAETTLPLDHLREHLGGHPRDLSHLPLSTNGVPPFLLKVMRTAQRIPPGETRTYGQLAAMAGSPKASRAVGQAMATNRWPIVVPCHRVFAGDGFGNYSAGQGVHTKLRLLWREGYRGPTSNVGFSPELARAHISERDPAMAHLVTQAGPFTLQATAPTARASEAPFVALARSIVYQQLTGKAAATIDARVKETLGGTVAAETVLRTSKAKLREAGLSENKALALIDLAKRTLAGELPSRAAMDRMDDEQLLEAFQSVRGIGRWSGQMLLMFYLGRPDVLPVLDLGVRKGFQRLMRMRALPSEQTLERAAKAWAPYRSVASWYLWRAVELPLATLERTPAPMMRKHA